MLCAHLKSQFADMALRPSHRVCDYLRTLQLTKPTSAKPLRKRTDSHIDTSPDSFHQHNNNFYS